MSSIKYWTKVQAMHCSQILAVVAIYDMELFHYDGGMIERITSEHLTTNMLTVSQAAKTKKLTRSAIYAAIADGRLPRRELLGRLVILQKDLERWTPQPNKGRPKGSAMSEKARQRISLGQSRRWSIRRRLRKH
jgi:predicted DNA-binding transcriptional regulator AlpA